MEISSLRQEISVLREEVGYLRQETEKESATHIEAAALLSQGILHLRRQLTEALASRPQ